MLFAYYDFGDLTEWLARAFAAGWDAMEDGSPHPPPTAGVSIIGRLNPEPDPEPSEGEEEAERGPPPPATGFYVLIAWDGIEPAAVMEPFRVPWRRELPRYGGQTEAEAPPPVPVEVSLFQARVYLRRQPGRQNGATLFDEVDHAVAMSGDGELAEAWQRASVVRRHSKLVLALAFQLGLTDAELDSMFRDAFRIEV